MLGWRLTLRQAGAATGGLAQHRAAAAAQHHSLAVAEHRGDVEAPLWLWESDEERRTTGTPSARMHERTRNCEENTNSLPRA